MSRKFNTKKFIMDVLNDMYALVIGNEILMDTKVEPTGDVHQFLLRKVNERGKEQYISYNDIALYKSERINPVREMVESGDLDICADAVAPELMALLSTKLFNTILTTTTEGFLEAAMRKIWGKELRVVNIYDKDTVDELQKVMKACRKERKYNQPTLIYVFGKMVPEDLPKKYIRTEADAILLIEKWMRMDTEANNELLEFIRSKRLLALGCKYDNWYFRFFWYVLTGSIDSEKYDGTGEVAFALNTAERSESQLHQFLDRTNICILGDAFSFIKNMTKMLTVDYEGSPFRLQIENSRHQGGIFISYCSKDALVASRLFFHLCEKKYDVWLDNARLYGGDNYETEIADSICSAKIFIAVLSPHVAEDLKKGETDHYYNKEWRMAQQFGDKIVIPLAINGYDLRSDYHKGFEAIVNQQPHGINLMDADGFQQLITSIKEHSTAL